MKQLELRLPPPLVMLIIGSIMWLLSVLFSTLDLPWLSNTMAAGAISLLGVIISLAGIATFQRARTTIDPKRLDQTSTLVSSGIYHYSRNPMYLGVLLILTGWAVFLGNLLALLCLPLFIAYITRFQIIPEERLLQEKFGQKFLDYKTKVRRWV